MPKALITGGAGFIGSHLTDKLAERGYKIKIIDNLFSGKREYINSAADFYKADIRNIEEIKPIFRGTDFVFHLAAVPRVPISIKNPSMTTESNVLGTVNVFQAAKEAGCKKAVFASSSSVYGRQEKLPLVETMEPNPVSPYGLQKWGGERFADMFKNLYNFLIVSLRFFNVYGPRIDFNSDYSLVLGKFLKQKKEGKPLTIFGDGEQSRGFCFISDTTEAIISTAESEKLEGGEIINVGSEKAETINRLAEIIGGEKRYLPPRKGDPRHTKADIIKARKLLNWKPKTSFEEGIKITQNWFNNL